MNLKFYFSAPGGDFQTVLDEDMVPFEQDVQGFLRQILDALVFIHERNIAHLDIKVLSLTQFIWKIFIILNEFCFIFLNTFVHTLNFIFGEFLFVSKLYIFRYKPFEFST